MVGHLKLLVKVRGFGDKLKSFKCNRFKRKFEFGQFYSRKLLFPSLNAIISITANEMKPTFYPCSTCWRSFKEVIIAAIEWHWHFWTSCKCVLAIAILVTPSAEILKLSPPLTRIGSQEKKLEMTIVLRQMVRSLNFVVFERIVSLGRW